VGALILTYHAVEQGPAPLCLTPELFRSHLDVFEELGVSTLTVSELAERLRDSTLPERAVAITFDDGCASAVRTAAPALAERGMSATFFCVAGHLGGWNDWPTQPASAPRLALADEEELRELAQLGFEIGAHGNHHLPLGDADADVARREVEDSKLVLEKATGRPVRSFGYPYGAPPASGAARLVAQLYGAACGNFLHRVDAQSDPMWLPRVDAHYVRHPGVLHRVAGDRWGTYLRLRGVGARARRLFRSDHVPVPSRPV
jgi:peptidoglycan/xylan/chitin deacetylase (PgdA/CDA1 family)